MLQDGQCVHLKWRCTQVGRRGAPAKGVGRETGAVVRIHSSPPKKSENNVLGFFYPSRRLGISLTHGVRRISSALWAVSHHALACILLRLDDIQNFVLMIYRNKLRMIYKATP